MHLAGANLFGTLLKRRRDQFLVAKRVERTKDLLGRKESRGELRGAQKKRATRSSNGENGVDISPGVGVYGMFPSFNYKPWLAIAEFLDNSISSFQANREQLVALHGPEFKLRLMVSYDADANTLVIRDNAFGIDTDRFEDAFALARPPEDLRYISRYGVGMKAAACWFARSWSVRTTAWGEDIERTLNWVTNDIIDGSVTKLVPSTKKVDRNEHYTVITLRKLIHPPNAPRTAAKIKAFLPNIYREFMRDGEVELLWNGEGLTVVQPEILAAPPQWDQQQPSRLWEENVTLAMEDGHTITGRVIVLKKMKRSYTALNLFWHNRLILGNIEPNHRPQELFGAGNSFETGRLCVELHMDEYEPTVDKGGFKFQDNESQLESVIDELKRQAAPIIRQARDYREPRIDLETPVPDIGPVIVIPAGEVVVEPAPSTPADPYPTPAVIEPNEVKQLRELAKVEIAEDGLNWEIHLRQGVSPGDNEFVRIEEIPPSDDNEPYRLFVTLGGQHPFVLQYWSDDQEIQRVLLLLASAIGFGEIAARHAGMKYASFVRNNVDRFLRLVVRHERDHKDD